MGNYKLKQVYQRLLGIVFLISPMLIAACSTVHVNGNEVRGAEKGASSVQSIVESTPEISKDESLDGENQDDSNLGNMKIEVNQEVTVQPQMEEVKPLKEIKQGLAASNPGDFKIIAGKYQIVEFFAFW